MTNGPEEAPRVSVIVRTRDRPRLLAEALDSLRAQTFTLFETLVVNDGGAIPAGVLAPAPGLGLKVVVPGPPGGRSRALNAGLAAARGEYAAYLDDDDLFRPAHLATLVRFLDGSDEYGAAYTAAEQVAQHLGPDGRYAAGERLVTYGRPFDARRILYKNDVPLITLMHRLDLVGKAGPFDQSLDLFEDWDFLIRLSRVTRIRFLPEATAVYRLRDDASNATTVSTWHGARAEAARKALFVKHAALRGAETEMALVDSFDEEWWQRESELTALRRRAETAERKTAPLEEEVKTLRSELSHVGEETGRREAALAKERNDLKRELEAIHRSRWWRLATSWWRLKERFKG